MTDDSNLSFKKLLQDFASLHLNEEFSDVILNINGEKLYAHKVILAVRSNYFKKLLYGDLQESKQFEITIHDVPTTEAFKTLLEFIYTGDVTIEPSNVDLALEVLIQAHKYCIDDLVDVVTEKLEKMMTLENVSHIINTANLYNFGELKDSCLRFLDETASGLLKFESFLQLTQESVVEILKRDTFFAPEVEIFKAIARWLENNRCEDTSWITSCVRLGWMSAHDIVSVVRPTQLIDNNILLNAVAQAMDVEPKRTVCRGRLVADKNVASLKEQAEVLLSNSNSIILDEKIKQNVTYYECHNIDDKNGIIIKLGVPHVLNTINMVLFYESGRVNIMKPYSYYIEVSTDFTNWKRIIDYSDYQCLGPQIVHFGEEMVLYIKVVGTYSSTNNELRLLNFIASYFSECLQMVDGFVKPDKNIAFLNRGTTVVEGLNRYYLLSPDGDLTKKKTDTYGYHMINSPEKIIIQLCQPYILSSLLLVLYENRKYRYYIEVSTDKNSWEKVVDFRNENRESIQHVNFPERVVVFIRIVGIYSSADDGEFRCRYFECPAVHIKEADELFVARAEN